MQRLRQRKLIKPHHETCPRDRQEVTWLIEQHNAMASQREHRRIEVVLIIGLSNGHLTVWSGRPWNAPHWPPCLPNATDFFRLLCEESISSGSRSGKYWKYDISLPLKPLQDCNTTNEFDKMLFSVSQRSFLKRKIYTNHCAEKR